MPFGHQKNIKFKNMKNILLALICLVSFSFKTLGDDKPVCCTDKCSKECIEKCKKNKCTDKDCCKECETKGCQGKACKHDGAACCANHKDGKETCKAGKCDEKCKTECKKEGKDCCKK